MATISLYHFFRTRFFWAALFMALVSPSPTAHAGTILYVDAFGECGGKPNCFLTPDTALAAASGGDTLWIANGDYPDGANVVDGYDLVFDGGWNADFTTRSNVNLTIAPGALGQMIVTDGTVRVMKTRNIVRLSNFAECSDGASFVADLTDIPSLEFWESASGELGVYQSWNDAEIGPFDADLKCLGVKRFLETWELPEGIGVSLELSSSGSQIFLALYSDGSFSSTINRKASGSFPGGLLGEPVVGQPVPTDR